MSSAVITSRTTMHLSHFPCIASICLVGFGSVGLSQQPAMPIRPLGAIVATATEPVSGPIRAFSDGRVLVNDPTRRRLVLLDSTLGHVVVVADTTTATGKAYGQGLTGLIPFTGDSSLIQDEVTGAYLVLDQNGKISRILPKLGVIPGNGGPSGSAVGFDRAGHLLFRASAPIFLSLLDARFIGDTLMVGPDSNPILRVDLTTHRMDTAAMLKAPRLRQAVTRRAPNSGQGRVALNPIRSGDDWAILDDGSVAVVRVSDYHVDWIQPNGHSAAGAKVPTQWVRITDSMKVAIMDSVRGRGAGRGGRGASPLAGAPAQAYVTPLDLPDFQPPFTMGMTRADAEGNVWVRANPSASGTVGMVYDVIGRNGGLIDRVRIPASQTVVGFGPGVVYLASDANGLGQLSKVRIH